MRRRTRCPDNCAVITTPVNGFSQRSSGSQRITVGDYSSRMEIGDGLATGRDLLWGWPNNGNSRVIREYSQLTSTSLKRQVPVLFPYILECNVSSFIDFHKTLDISKKEAKKRKEARPLMGVAGQGPSACVITITLPPTLRHAGLMVTIHINGASSFFPLSKIFWP